MIFSFYRRITKNKDNDYKTKDVNYFSEFIFCSYGSRCRYKHNER